jgi:PAS domain S-box-containing protein
MSVFDPSRSIRILCVAADDRAAHVESTITADSAQFDVTTVTTLDAARHELRTADCVVSAYSLPDATGLDLLETVRETASDVPFVLVAEDDRDGVAREAISHDVTEYLLWDELSETPLASQLRTAVSQRRRRHRTSEFESHARVFLEASPEMIAVSVDGEFAYVNDAAVDLLGATDPDELVGRPVTDIVHPDDVTAAREDLDAIQGGRRTVSRRGRKLLTVDGCLKYAEVTARHVEWKGRPAVLSIVRDVTERTRKERALFEQTRRFQRIVAQLDGVAIWMSSDDPSDVQYVSPGYEEIWGRSRESLYDDFSFFLEGVHPDDADEVSATLDRIRRDVAADDLQEEYHARFRVSPPEASVRWVEAVAVPLVDEGEVTNWVGVVHDVTDRESRERELARYRTLVDILPDPVWVVDTDERLTHVNESLVDGLPLSREEILGRTLSEFVVDEDILDREDFDALHESIQAILRGDRSVVRTEVELTRPDGRVVRDVAISPFTRDGEVVGAVGVNRDVTEQTRHAEELAVSQERYRALLDGAPDPIFIADPETGTIVETNEAATELLGRSREGILGLHQTDLHPPDDRRQYVDLFDRHSDREPAVERELPDGSPIYVYTADGERIPVEINARMIECNGTQLFQGIFRDISAQRENERTLTALHGVATDLLDCDSVETIGERVVDVAADLVDAETVTAYAYDAEDGILRSLAHVADDALERGHRTLAPGDGVGWTAFCDGERAVEAVDVPADGVGAVLAIPLGEYGVLVVRGRSTAAFDATTLELAETVAATAEAALSRTRREQSLRERDRELKRQNRELERANNANRTIRSINRILVDAKSRDEIQQAVCSKLVDSGAFSFAWFGEPDLVSNALEPRAWAGEPDHYLDAVDPSLDDEGSEPAERTARTREVTVVENVAANVRSEPWREEALVCEFRSVISIPVVYDDVLYGVVTAYAPARGAVDERSILAELGDTIGLAINAINRRNALFSDRRIELEFRVREADTVLHRLATALDADVSMEVVSPRSDGGYHLYAIVDASSPDLVRSTARETPGVESVRRVGDSDTRFELCVSEPCLATILADIGAIPQSIVYRGDGGHVTVELPHHVDVRSFVDRFRDRSVDANLVAQRRHRANATDSRLIRVDEPLTDRQHEALELAYFGGFFEWPRDATGQDVASLLGISQPAFAQRLRSAERKLASAYCRTTTPTDHADGDH